MTLTAASREVDEAKNAVSPGQLVTLIKRLAAGWRAAICDRGRGKFPLLELPSGLEVSLKVAGVLQLELEVDCLSMRMIRSIARGSRR